MKKLFKNKIWGKLPLYLLIAAVVVGGNLFFAPDAKAVSIYSVTEATATVGTATNLEIEYTADTGEHTWADGDTLTVTLPDNFPIWSALTTEVEYDKDVTNNGVDETPITQGVGNGQYSISGRIMTVKWNLTGWAAVVDDASTVRILVTAGATPMYANATSSFVFAGVTAVGADPSGSDDINVSVADPLASIDVTAVDTVGETGNVVATFDIAYPLVNGDQVWLTLPANYNVASAAVVSDTFTGDFTVGVCTIASQTIKCAANGGIAAQGAGTLTLSGIKAKYEAATATYTTALYDVSATANISSASDAIGATAAATSFTGEFDASLVATVGVTSGSVPLPIAIPVALEAGDTIKINFPNNWDISGITTGANKNYNLDQTVTIAVSGQLLTITLEGPQAAGAEQINFENDKIIAKYAATGQSATVLVEKSTNQDVIAASANAGVVKSINDTIAGDPLSSIDVSAISEYNKIGNTVVSFTLPHALADNDELRLTIPTNYNIASAAFVSDSFGGGNFDACAASGQVITCTANGAITAGAGTVTISGIRAAANAVTAASTYTTTLHSFLGDATIATASNDAIAGTTVDATAPTLAGADIDADNNSSGRAVLTLQFSENMDPTTAQDITHYTVIKNGGGLTYSLDTAVLTNDTVVLTLVAVNPADPTTFITNAETAAHVQITPSTHILDANGVAYGGAQVTQGGTTLVDAGAPTLAATAIIVNNAVQPNTVTLTFNEPLDKTLAETEGNWVMTDNAVGINYGIALATMDITGKIITLTLNAVNPAVNTTFITNADATAGIKVTPNGALTDVNGVPYTAGLVTASVPGTQDGTPPTLAVANIDVDNLASPNTVTLQFSEKLNKTTAEDITHYAVTNNSGSITYTLASAALTNDTVVLTLAGFDIDVPETYITNGAIAGHINVTPLNHILDVAGVAYGGAIVTEAGGSHTLHTSVPTVTVGGTSNDKLGDTITLTFNEAMDTTTITNTILNADTNVTLDYSDNAGNTGQANIPLAHATVAWNGAKLVATITLNEATDLAYIPNNKYLGATLVGVTDIYGIAEAGTEVYSGAGIAKEATKPTITVAANSVNNGGDTVVITSDEELAATATTTSNWTVQYDDNGSGLNIQTVTLAYAVTTIDATRKIVTITLDEVTDGAYIPSSKYVKVTPNASNISDLVGNNTVTAAYSAAVTTETTAPTISAVSVADAAIDIVINPTITITLSEALSPLSVNSNTVKLYTDVGNNILVNIGTDTEVPITVSLENNGASTKIRITPLSNLSNSGNYIYRVSTGVKDLSGNALAANADYDFTTVDAGAGSFGVISTTMTKITGTADASYANGWEWVIRMTLPTNQNDFALKFNNWASGSNTLAAASNMRYYSEQIAAGTGSSAGMITITAADTYEPNVTISTDADATLDGIQTDIHVQVKIPTSTTAGSYSTSYRVNYE